MNIKWFIFITTCIILLANSSSVLASDIEILGRYEDLRNKEAEVEQKPSLSPYEDNPFTPQDEGDHMPCKCEWWTFHCMLDFDDGTRKDVLIQFQYGAKNETYLTNFLLLLYFFDRDTGKMDDYTIDEVRAITGEKIPFSCKKNMIDIKYRNCTMKGLYPNYHTYVEDEEKRVTLDLYLNATSIPHWIAQDEANGYFPWGGGWSRYGFIPQLEVTGKINFEGKKSNVTGIAYHEHVWGNFSYVINDNNIRYKIKETIKNLKNTMPFIKWIVLEQSFKFPKALMFTTDNDNGYDWGWATFDNGWSVHFGIFYLMNRIVEGPALGELSLSPDGKNYWDFGDIDIKCGNWIYYDEADVFLPMDIELRCNKGDKKLYLSFITTTESYKSLCIYPATKNSCGRGGTATCGVVEGYYKDKDQKIPLNGKCTVSSFRKFLATKHNSKRIEFICPPDGIGFSIEINSHQRGYEMFYKRQLLPYPEHHFDIKRVPKTPIQEPKFPESYPNATCLFVGGVGNDNHSKIQDAIDNTSTGDTVLVYNGTYYENLVINNSIHLIGENKDNVIIKGRDRDILRVNANYVEIAGFTIDAKKLDTWDDSAIELSSSDNFIHNNKLINSEWYGIHIKNSSYNIIENNSIINISIGIWIYKSNANIVRNNNITLCNWVGMWIWHSSRDNVIKCNNFIDNRINIQNSDPRFKNKWDYNYWDDYFGLKFKRLADLNNNGVGSIPYRISRFNFDWHPLMEVNEI